MNTNEEMKVVNVPISEIYADPEMNCRGAIIPMDVLELVQSIEKNGLQQPITIQPYDKVPSYKYRIVIGHRRHMAFVISKKKTIPAIIKEGLSEIQTRILNLQENLERKDLNMMQEALAIKKFKDAGYTLNEVSKMIGMSTGWVQIRYNLLDLEPEIQQAASTGILTQEQVKDLYSLPTTEDRFEAVKSIKDSRLRGDKKALKVKKSKKNPTVLKQRKRDEIFEMQEHIIDSVGANFGTRTLAWAAGEISDLDLYRDIKEIAEEKGVKYISPVHQMVG